MIGEVVGMVFPGEYLETGNNVPSSTIMELSKGGG